MIHLHHEICQALSVALEAASNNTNPSTSFDLQLAYANYESSCKKYGLVPVPLEWIVAKGLHGSSKVVYIPFGQSFIN